MTHYRSARSGRKEYEGGNENGLGRGGNGTERTGRRRSKGNRKERGQTDEGEKRNLLRAKIRAAACR